jgi:ABC-type spermidine/putrescine transport system permease subunit II
MLLEKPPMIAGIIFGITTLLNNCDSVAPKSLAAFNMLSFIFVTGNGFSVLSVEVYAMARKGISMEINAISTILFMY